MKRSTWIGFAVFCALASAEWLIPPSAADAMPGPERRGLVYGVVSLAALLLVALRRENVDRSAVRWGSLLVGGVGFFGVPAAFFEWAAGRLSGMTEAAAFAAVPAAVAIIVSSTDMREGARRLLVPALAGFGGALLLLPFVLPTTARGQVLFACLVAIVVLIAILSVWLNMLLQEVALDLAVAVFGFANAAFLLVCSRMSSDLVWRWSTLSSLASIRSLFEAAELILTIWLLRDIPPERFASRYLVIPFLTVLQGFLIFRSNLTARMGFGMALLVVGATVILFSRGKDEQESLSLR